MTGACGVDLCELIIPFLMYPRWSACCCCHLYLTCCVTFFSFSLSLSWSRCWDCFPTTRSTYRGIAGRWSRASTVSIVSHLPKHLGEPARLTLDGYPPARLTPNGHPPARLTLNGFSLARLTVKDYPPTYSYYSQVSHCVQVFSILRVCSCYLVTYLPMRTVPGGFASWYFPVFV